MDQTPSDSRDEELVNDRQLDDTVQFLLASLEHGIKLLGLRNGAWETVQHEPARLKNGVSWVFRGHIYSQKGKDR